MDFTPLGYQPSREDGKNNRVVSYYDPNDYVLASSNGLLLQCTKSDDFYFVNPMTGKKCQIPLFMINFPVGSNFASVCFR